MISTELRDLADTLEARGEAMDSLAPAECLGVAAALRSLAERAAQMEDRPIPAERLVALQPALTVIEGGKAPLAFRMGGGL